MRPVRAAATVVRSRARDITLLGCVASNSIGAALLAPAAGFLALGLQGLALLALEMKGTARGTS